MHNDFSDEELGQIAFALVDRREKLRHLLGLRKNDVSQDARLVAIERALRRLGFH